MTGVVVDIGDGATHIVPVVDGYVIGSSIKSFPIAGNDVTRFVLQLLRVQVSFSYSLTFLRSQSRIVFCLDASNSCYASYVPKVIL